MTRVAVMVAIAVLIAAGKPAYGHTGSGSITSAAFAQYTPLSVVMPFPKAGMFISPGEIRWRSLSDARRRAKEQQKKVLIYFHAEWCGQCRAMEEEVFTSNDVAGAVDEYFQPVKLDAESRGTVRFGGQQYTRQELAHVMGANAVPTFVFIDSDGEIIGRQQGAMEKQVFYRLMHYIGSDAYRHTDFQDFSVP